MKYDDDELAEAALLLAHLPADEEMPAALENKLLAHGRSVASEIRFTTTKAAAVAVERVEAEAEVDGAPARPRSLVRAWGGWFAAAACVAFLAYQWRSHTIEREREATERAAAAAQASRSVELEAGTGGTIGRVRWETTAESARVTIDRLPANAPGEHYRVWVSSSDAAHATALGAFICAEECRDRLFDVAGKVPVAATSIWVTRNPVAEVAAAPEGANIVAHGSHAQR